MMEENTKTVAKRKKDEITEQVLKRVQALSSSGDLKIHKDYSAENAIKSAYLILSETLDKNKKPVLETCSTVSVANSLLKMVTQGLNCYKKQGYFIAYAGNLEFVRSYIGDVFIGKRDANMKTVIAQAVYAKDKFKFNVDVETGNKQILEHEQTLQSLNSAVTGAYCIIEFNDGTKYVDIMPIEKITTSWNQRKGNGLTDAHKKFPDEMSKRTIIKRACKVFINTANDTYDEAKSMEAEVNQVIKEEANNEELDINDIEYEEVKDPIKAPIVEETKETEADPF